MGQLARVAGAAVAAALLLPGVHTPIAAREADAWRDAAIGHVRVVSDADAATTTALARRMSAVRALFARAAGVAVGDAAEPLLVIAPRDADGMKALVGDAAARNAGLLLAAALPSPFGHHLALRAGARPVEQSWVLQHEYVHLLTQAVRGELPAWLDEGSADFWRTLTTKDGRLIVGAPIDAYVKVLREARDWIPIDTLVSVPRGRYDMLPRGRSSLELFYAESWALVHYLLLRAPGAEMPIVPALPADIRSLLPALRTHVTGALAPIALVEHAVLAEDEDAESPAAIVSRTLPDADALALRASVLVYGEHPDRALALARRAVSADPVNALALESLGIGHLLMNEPAEARRWLAQAVDTTGGGYRAHYYYAVLSIDTPLVAISHLKRALELRPGFQPAVERLAMLTKSQ